MAAAAKRHPAQSTQEQLTLALRQLWRPGWPADLAAALAHPLYGTCVRGLARNLRRPPVTATPVPRLGAVHWAPPTPTPNDSTARTAAGRRFPPLGTFDAKRAAANDRDD
jgi:hypothetical protein